MPSNCCRRTAAATATSTAPATATATSTATQQVVLPFLERVERRLIFLKCVESVEVHVWEEGAERPRRLVRAEIRSGGMSMDDLRLQVLACATPNPYPYPYPYIALCILLSAIITTTNTCHSTSSLYNC